MVSYRSLLLLASILAVVGGTISAVRSGYPLRRALAILLTSLGGAFVGARIGCSLLTNHEDARTFSLLSLAPADLSLDGGILGALAIAFIMCSLLRVSLLHLLDRITPVVALSIAVLRYGCYLHGCCYGAPTSMPWGVQYGVGSAVHIRQIRLGMISPIEPALAVHPTQIYELIAGLIGAALAWFVLLQKETPGTACCAFLLWFAVFRLINSTMRLPVETTTITATLPSVGFLLLALCGLLVLSACRPSLSPSSHPPANHNNPR